MTVDTYRPPNIDAADIAAIMDGDANELERTASAERWASALAVDARARYEVQSGRIFLPPEVLHAFRRILDGCPS